MIHINQVFYLLCINTYMKTFQLPPMICFIPQLNQIDQYHFIDYIFPKLWNSIELELKETKSAKSFKRKVAQNYLDSYSSYICKKLCFMWINLIFNIFFTLQFINMILIIYVNLCSNPTAEYPTFTLYFFTISLPFPDLSSLFCLKCTLYSVHPCIYLYSHSIMGQPIKTTYSGQAGPNYIVNCDFLFVLSRLICS